MAKPAKPSFWTGVLRSITGEYTEQQLKPYIKEVYSPQERLFTDTEREKLLDLAARSENPSYASSTDPLNYFTALSRKNAKEALDNDAIIQMAPEISLAASVMIPSILAPNDMREGVIRIDCTAEDIEEDDKTKIADLITDFFEDYFDFSTALPKWIYEAMYRSGAKPLMILPLSTLEKELTDNKNLTEGVSTEALNTYRQYCRKLDDDSVYGFSDTNYYKHKSSTGSISTESLNGLCKDFVSVAKAHAVKPTSRAAEAMRAFVESVCSTENLNIIDNPDSISLNRVRNKKVSSKISQKTALRYQDQEVDSIPVPEAKDPIIGNPVFFQLPMESVIPIYTPGTPSDHIGYFVLLDEYGHPIDAMDIKNNGLFNTTGMSNYSNDTSQNSFSALYQAYGFTQNGVGNLPGSVPEKDVMENIYQQIVEAHLKQRAENAGLADISLGQNSSLYRCMFTRFLQQRKTKLLFVPKELLIYFCYKHSQYGTGVSKLDDLKWILSLRISNLVSRMLAAFKNAIDRKVISINFDEKFAGNALMHMRTAQREAISKDLVSFSYNPTGVAQQIAQQSYSVDVNGIPGITNYKITRDADQRIASTSPPDTDLANDIKNLELLGLEVPPAVMNSLNDAEFSRSVATTNIVFSRKLMGYQKITCRYMTDFVQTFVRYSKNLRTEIATILKQSSDDTSQDKGTLVRNGKSPLDKRVRHAIEHLEVTLPSPTMAPDNAQFETINAMVTAYSSLADLYIPDDIAGDDTDLKGTVAIFRAFYKSDLLQKVLRRSGLEDEDFPDIFKDYDASELLKVRQAMINLTRGIKQQSSALGMAPDDGSGGMGGMSDMGSGMGGSTPPDSFGPSDDSGDVDNFGDTSGSTTETESTTSDTGDTSDTTSSGETDTSLDEGGPTGTSLV